MAIVKTDDKHYKDIACKACFRKKPIVFGNHNAWLCVRYLT